MKELLVKIEEQLKGSVKDIGTFLARYKILIDNIEDSREALDYQTGALKKARAELKEVENKKSHQELKNRLEAEIKRYEGLCVNIAKNHAKAVHDANKAALWTKEAETKRASAAECEQTAIKKGSAWQAKEKQLELDRKQLEKDRGDFADKEIEYLIRMDSLSKEEDKAKAANKEIIRRRANLNATEENLKVLEKELKAKYGKK